MRIVYLALMCLLMLLVVIGCGKVGVSKGVTSSMTPSASDTATPVITKQFVPLQGDVVNPERGFRYSFDDLDPDTDFSVYRSLGTSIVYSYVRLDRYRDSDLPQDFLDRVQSAFDALREGGVKVVLRFAYNFGPYPNSDPDASKEQILRHIDQLTPLLQRNADVIAWMHAGFIGAWGEWHTSTHGLDRDMTAKQEILYALLDALPSDRMVQLRYPWDIIRMFPNPLTEEQAFSGTYQSRVGFHNDCFLSSDTDVGTYDRQGRNTRAEDQAYLAQITQFTPAGGETCQVYPPLQKCDMAIKEMETLHFSDLNLSYHQRVLRNWQTEGCFEEIKQRLGYRLVLQEVSFPASVQPDSDLLIEVKLSNDGFAAPVNPRPLYLVLQGSDIFTFPVQGVDPRRWLPGNHAFTVSVALPASLPAGQYNLALWLPDHYETLRNDHDPRYSLRFANEGVWDEQHGWNVIGDIRVP